MGDELLRGTLDSSGFPFQMAVAHAVATSPARRLWRIAATEHPYLDRRTGSAAFVDLILYLRNQFLRLVIECKRQRDAHWVFLVPPDSSPNITRQRVYWTRAIPVGDKVEWRGAWDDISMAPDSPESEFCLVRGQDEERGLMLERISGNLLAAIEAISAEERLMVRPERLPVGSTRVYLPMIVTTAKLYTCAIEPAQVSLLDGTVPNPEFRPVPCIRFAKTLATEIPASDTWPAALADADTLRARTVFVVSAEHLTKVLEGWSIHFGGFDGPPWALENESW